MPKNNQDRRRYLRLDTVLPVEFEIRRVTQGKEEVIAPWQQGFTQDLAYAGIGLRANFLAQDIADLPLKDLILTLNIHLPFRKERIPARGRLAWAEKISGQFQGLTLGLEFTDITKRDRRALLGYARYRRNIPRIGWGIIIILLAAVLVAQSRNLHLRAVNQRLISDLGRIREEFSHAREEARKLDIGKQALDEQLFSARAKIRRLKGSLAAIKIDLQKQQVGLGEKEPVSKDTVSGAEQELKRLNAALKDARREKDMLEQRLKEMSQARIKADLALSQKKQRKLALEKETFDKMYAWVKIRQDYKSGLIASFLGDKKIEDWAFTYDQALATIAFVRFGDFERAGRILDFYLGHLRPGRGFANAYYASGGDVSEYVVHSGPNIWLGIAALQYAHKTKDNRYLGLARHIAAWLLKLQKEDKLGGIRGGPRVSWFATEHNLDAYAFFDMFYRISGKEKYRLARDKVFEWLKAQSYHQQDVPIWRGKGDSTIATDTYFWSIAAVGPQRLAEIGMDPDEIVKFAEDTCSVETEWTRPGQTSSAEPKKIKVSGFDFAPQRHLPRGGIVSTEFTAQVIVSHKIMADYHRKKGNQNQARLYRDKAEALLNELSKMLILNVSKAGHSFPCLPYASQENADTGHGWWTPKGEQTASLSATIYTLFGYYGFNPLAMEDDKQ